MSRTVVIVTGRSTRFTTAMPECWTPYELHLVPGAVTETQGA
ncbi:MULTISPECIES: hypothetical protein [unclassified Streptomyces]